ncbi:MAG: Uma2 family endonuclease [Candidatus Viridilinea halotolerans]|uniref:Uma2 family endonuclease n=1 Tax=Candidatus Viridilinea halotolerans TaxID=2491704 RepID=A0A426TWB0_9CHLR|nr:MAG: Uma2 family endonuclease [Candidatus Viridilinea halotolerans]
MVADADQAKLHIRWQEDDESLMSLERLQGHWTEEQYLLMTDQTKRLLEYSDGYLEVLPMPTEEHQDISQFLFLALLAFLQGIGGKVYYAPLRVRIRANKFREPDLLLVRDAHDPRRQNRYWLGADLVVEVVSAGDPERDTKVKRNDYAQAGIPEYWIVNPLTTTITVLVLEGETYTEHGCFSRGEDAVSKLLDGFRVRVDAVFDAK